MGLVKTLSEQLAELRDQVSGGHSADVWCTARSSSITQHGAHHTQRITRDTQCC